MTVLVLDSPELIARAAALEAGQANAMVQAEEARVIHGAAEGSTPDQPACQQQEEDSVTEQQEDTLALVV